MVNVSFEELLKLSVPERIQRAEDRWDSIAAEPEALPLTDTQRAETERRLAEHDRDPASALPWEEVRERLRQRFE
ncbi:MAG: addiction module protein [Rubrobacteraceae bacterium]